MTRKFGGGKLVVATHNRGKLEEMIDLIGDLKIELVAASELGLPVPDEPGETFVENATIKALAAATASGLPALADDSGLCIDALHGAPGVHTADWAETGRGRDFNAAMARVYNALLEAGAKAPWSAAFNCTLALAWPDGHVETVSGRAEGCIVWPPRGDQGHGYDPIFLPAGGTITYGEMDRWAKNRSSHRAVAVELLRKQCFT